MKCQYGYLVSSCLQHNENR